MKYTYRPVQIEAIQYDGISQYDTLMNYWNVSFISYNFDGTKIQFGDSKEAQPINIGDYIIKDEFNKYQIIKEENFDKYFKIIE